MWRKRTHPGDRDSAVAIGGLTLRIERALAEHRKRAIAYELG